MYLRSQGGLLAIVGIDRDWPGKVIAPPGQSVRRGPSRYPELDAKQTALFEKYNVDYNSRTGRTYTPQEGFDALTLSQQTTFDAVTHALM